MARRPGGEAEIHARIAAAPGLSSPEAHRLAGFLDAECCFAILPNNRDGWRCLCQVALRDDDRDTLTSFREQLGIGHLRAVRARAGSRPQVNWTISSKVECARLVKLLDSHPLRGRKLAEYEIWREAVTQWVIRRYGLAPGGRTRLQRLAAHLKAARVYRDHAGVARPAMSDESARYYLAGFFSGEGSFRVGPRDARLVIKLRRDDRPLLEAFRDGFGIGTVCDVEAYGPWSPAAVWHVTGGQDVLRGITLLDRGGLLGRKERQFRAWRPGAEAVALAKIARRPVEERLVAASRRALAQATAYTPPAERLRLDPGYGDARSSHIDVLRAWAASENGRLTCSAYEAARAVHRHWPKRDTIAFAFGGWYEALRSAGLADRAARRPSGGQLRVQLD
jgi:LAGLIDADG endonuclease